MEGHLEGGYLQGRVYPALGKGTRGTTLTLSIRGVIQWVPLNPCSFQHMGGDPGEQSLTPSSPGALGSPCPPLPPRLIPVGAPNLHLQGRDPGGSPDPSHPCPLSSQGWIQ